MKAYSKAVLRLFVLVILTAAPALAQKANRLAGRSGAERGVTRRQPESLPQLIRRVKPSVVAVLTYDEQGTPLGQGSGFFVAPDRVVTSLHVIEGARRAEVKKLDGITHPVSAVLTIDEVGDLALLQVSLARASGAPFLSVTAAPPQEGEQVFVVGDPLGLEGTISDGIVSAVRAVEGSGYVIQITAPISPGSSGGPVVNLQGQVLGVAAFQRAEGQNLNFAVPGFRITALRAGHARTVAEISDQLWERRRARAEESFRRGVSLYEKEEQEKALRHFGEAVRVAPNYPAAWFYAGRCLLALRQYDRAAEAYAESIRLKPDLAEAYNDMGVALHNHGRHREALEAYAGALRLKPGDVQARYNMGVAYSALENHHAAAEQYKAAIALDRGDAKAHYNLGLTLLHLRDRKGAKKEHKILQSIDPALAYELYLRLGK